jgi:hypothetical protein
VLVHRINLERRACHGLKIAPSDKLIKAQSAFRNIELVDLVLPNRPIDNQN